MEKPTHNRTPENNANIPRPPTRQEILAQADQVNALLLVTIEADRRKLLQRMESLDEELAEVGEADREFLERLEEQRRQYFQESNLKKQCIEDEKQQINNEVDSLVSESEKIRQLSIALGGLTKNISNLAESLEDAQNEDLQGSETEANVSYQLLNALEEQAGQSDRSYEEEPTGTEEEPARSLQTEAGQVESGHPKTAAIDFLQTRRRRPQVKGSA